MNQHLEIYNKSSKIMKSLYNYKLQKYLNSIRWIFIQHSKIFAFCVLLKGIFFSKMKNSKFLLSLNKCSLRLVLLQVFFSFVIHSFDFRKKHPT